MWCKSVTGLTLNQAYEKYYVKGVVTDLLRAGLSQPKALAVLEAMGILNPKTNKPYNSLTLRNLLRDRLWGKGIGKTWYEMRDIYMEPILEGLYRNGLSDNEINNLLGMHGSFAQSYRKRVWGFDSSLDAINFFQNNYLGYHKYENYL